MDQRQQYTFLYLIDFMHIIQDFIQDFIQKVETVLFCESLVALKKVVCFFSLHVYLRCFMAFEIAAKNALHCKNSAKAWFISEVKAVLWLCAKAVNLSFNFSLILHLNQQELLVELVVKLAVE